MQQRKWAAVHEQKQHNLAITSYPIGEYGVLRVMFSYIYATKPLESLTGWWKPWYRENADLSQFENPVERSGNETESP